MIIGICGLKRTGKDTVANIISSNYKNIVSYSLALPIKKILIEAIYKIKPSLKITFEDINGETNFDREKNIFTKQEFEQILFESYCSAAINASSINNNHITYCQSSMCWFSQNVTIFSIRTLMQVFGTDIIVNTCSVNFWVYKSLDYYMSINNNGNFNKHMIISDIRQQHEISFLRSINAPIIHIIRLDVNNSDSHITEAGLNYDISSNNEFFISNDGSLEELELKVHSIMNFVNKLCNNQIKGLR